MNRIHLIGSIAVILLVLFNGCKKDWEEHYYDSQPVSVDMNMWDTIKQNDSLSMFVSLMEQFELDTLFKEEQTYTLFIPTNQAFENFLAEDTATLRTLYYHISRHLVQSGNISGTEKIQMIAEKFVPFRRNNSVILFDGIQLLKESPLYLNGKYYTMTEVARPKPNLFEYFKETNPILADYIVSLDSIEIDKELSRPIGFDQNGNTVYDTVLIITNEFEDQFFAVRDEFRNKTATIVFPKAEDYNNALTEMADIMGDVYLDYRDIPLSWQTEYLIPYLLEQGSFENTLSDIDFIKTGGPNDTLKLKNILGDSIPIEYQVTDKTLCSNGVAFNYQDFTVPDTLFNGPIRVEMEWITKETGLNKYSWDAEYATVNSTVPFEPQQTYVESASNDTIVKVQFNNDYDGQWAIEINVKNIFARKYLMVVRTNKGFGGVFNIYLNDDLIRTFDYYEYVKNQYFIYSVTGKRLLSEESGYRYWDAFAENTAPYGEAKLRIEYVEKSELVLPGLLIDYIDFIPYD